MPIIGFSINNIKQTGYRKVDLYLISEINFFDKTSFLVGIVYIRLMHCLHNRTNDAKGGSAVIIEETSIIILNLNKE